MNEKAIQLLENLLSLSDTVYYHKSQENIGNFYFYPNGLGCEVIVESPEVNGIKITIDVSKGSKYSLFINDVDTVIPTLDKMLRKIYLNKNPHISSEAELEKFDKYINKFKKILQLNEIKRVKNVQLIENSSGLKEIVVKDNTKKHKILIGKAQEYTNAVGGLLNLVEVLVLINDKTLNIYGNENSTLTMLIPGYELYKYPMLFQNIYIKDPRIYNNVEDIYHALCDSTNTEDKNFSKTFQYLLLSGDLENNNKKEKKNKL